MLESLFILLVLYCIGCYALVYHVLSQRLKEKNDWRDWILFGLSPVSLPFSIIFYYYSEKNKNL